MFISIIIPTFNRAHQISETLESVGNQIFSDWECIVVDDGSTDNTKEIIQNFYKKDSRFRYIYQENAERSAARNNGIKHAQGEWICFLDSDDLYTSDHLLTLNEAIESISEPSLIFTQLSSMYKNKITQEDYLVYNNKTDFFFENPVIPTRVCIHNSILKEFSFDPRIRIGEDTCLWSKIHLHYPIVSLPQYTAIYRQHNENSVNINFNCYLDQYTGIKIFFKEGQKNLFSRKIKRKIYSRCFYGIAKHYEYKRNFIGMCWWLLRSIITDISSPQTKSKIYKIYAFYR